MDLIAAAVVLAGVVLLFAGAALSVYATALLGVLIGGGIGYVAAPQVLGTVGAEGIAGFVGVVAVGGAVGALSAYLALSFATAIPGFVVGAYLGLYVITPLFTEGGLVRYLVLLLGGVAGALVAFTATKIALVFITAFVGAALASRAVTVADVTAAREAFSLDPILFDPLGATTFAGVELPLFGLLFVLGILSQVGLFKLGWVARLAGVLPGVGRNSEG